MRDRKCGDMIGAGRLPRVLLVLALVALSACASLPPRAALPDEPALAPAEDGRLAEAVIAAEARHPGQSGFRLVASGTEAYALRAFSARAAQRSLDIQTYIWHNDLTGRLMARHALRAADRGVRVRILVDDLDARAKNRAFAALDAHPNIAVRLYNPIASRRGTLRKAGEFLVRFRWLNHRMHNKNWIVDNRLALVGGRNLGNEYFDADGDTNFVDLDLLMMGPVVRETSAAFDRFWNATSNHPIAQLSPEQVSDAALMRLREALAGVRTELRESGYRDVLREDPQVRELMTDDLTLHWSADWHFVSDDPMKATLPREQRSAVLQTLWPAMAAARQELALISPYFVPGRRGTDALVAAVARGIDVRILTNSLAANDVAAVHGGYMRYRKPLLRGGVQLWELKPGSGDTPEFSLAGSSGSALHTKAVIVDDDQVFVGSYNLDPRSTSLNTEQGVLVNHPVLAAELRALFADGISGAQAWQVTLDGQTDLRWGDGEQVLAREPAATRSRRVMAWLARILPLESQL